MAPPSLNYEPSNFPIDAGRMGGAMFAKASY